tara:strand:- start:5 stop:250 length:246 start_codon:yes stop_codon:yes gene_type:complete
MGYYVVKRDQDVGGSPSDFYYYTNVENDGVEDTSDPLNGETQWGTDFTKKKVFANESDAQSVLDNSSYTPPNFQGAEVVSE